MEWDSEPGHTVRKVETDNYFYKEKVGKKRRT